MSVLSRSSLGLLFLTTGILKIDLLLHEPMVSNNALSDPWVVSSVCFLELAIALWVFSGMYQETMWHLVLFVLVVFLLVSFSKIILGHDSCECFGRFSGSPWVSLVVDLVSICVLFKWNPRLDKRQLPPRSVVRFVSVGIVSVLLLVGCLGLLPRYRFIASAQDAKRFAASNSVQLVPNLWAGRRLPLMDWIDKSKQLEEGEWLVLLYYASCDSCRNAIPKYRELCSDSDDSKVRVAFIEMPPYGDSILSASSSCIVGRLSDVKRWHAPAPVEIRLRDGVVIAARGHADAPSIDAVSSIK
jgi:methylamine utilization protein MauE